MIKIVVPITIIDYWDKYNTFKLKKTMEQEKGCTTCKNKGFQTKHLNLVLISVAVAACTFYGFVSLVRDLFNFFF